MPAVIHGDLDLSYNSVYDLASIPYNLRMEKDSNIYLVGNYLPKEFPTSIKGCDLINVIAQERKRIALQQEFGNDVGQTIYDL